MTETVKKRAVITGMGMVTPLGVGVDQNWANLIAGRSGIGPVTRFDCSEFRTRIAGEVKDFHPEDYLDRKAIKRMDLFCQFAMIAAREAMGNSGLVVTPEEADKMGCVLGCGLGGLMTLEKSMMDMVEKGPGRVSAFFIPMIIGNMAPGYLSIEHGLKGPNLCTATACAAGTHAVGQAMKLIENERCVAVMTGGVEAVVTPMGIAGFAAMKALSTRNDDPERASRPFDKDRDGFVVGEGSGILILEELEHARARGARIHAEVVGFGLSGDAYHITAPPEGGEGAVNSMQDALNSAGLTPADIDYINAHGTSTDLNDLYETQAIKTVFGPRAYEVPISSTKSMTGHLLGAAGGIEAIYSALTIQNGVIPPTINQETPDPACDLDYVPNQARQQAVRTVMSNSFGFGGTNGTLILKAFEP